MKELPPEYNSQLDNCHLLQIYYSADRKKYGLSKILIHIVEELKSLEKDGIHIKVDGAQIFVKVALEQISGDNLVMHSPFGFTESFVANHPSRFCLMHIEVMTKSYFEIEELLRERNMTSMCWM